MSDSEVRSNDGEGHSRVSPVAIVRILRERLLGVGAVLAPVSVAIFLSALWEANIPKAGIIVDTEEIVTLERSKVVIPDAKPMLLPLPPSALDLNISLS